jgi:hypothetical protein
LTEQKIQEGLDPQAARREAVMEFGGLEQVKEQVRDVCAGRLLEGFCSDVRHAWRMLFKMPLTAIVVVLSLGVGIGVNTTIFSWIQAVVFQPMPGVSGGGSFQQLEVRTETDAYSSARPMASEIRLHSSASTFSCFRPAFVSR